MVLDNKLNINDQSILAKEEEIISKKNAKNLYDSGYLNELDAGTFDSLSKIHKYLFDD